jgi:hypothetical protein
MAHTVISVRRSFGAIIPVTAGLILLRVPTQR